MLQSFASRKKYVLKVTSSPLGLNDLLKLLGMTQADTLKLNCSNITLQAYLTNLKSFQALQMNNFLNLMNKTQWFWLILFHSINLNKRLQNLCRVINHK